MIGLACVLPLLLGAVLLGGGTELSGRVLENWVAKTANLLVEELDAAPGSTIALRAPDGTMRERLSETVVRFKVLSEAETAAGRKEK